MALKIVGFTTVDSQSHLNNLISDKVVKYCFLMFRNKSSHRRYVLHVCGKYRNRKNQDDLQACVCTKIHYTQKGTKWNLYYLLQCKLLWTAIVELCGMCPLTAADWNQHSLNNCSTQSVVVYCHSESNSSADHYTGTARQREREDKCCSLRPRESVRYRHKD